jgi:hypothetical protein
MLFNKIIIIIRYLFYSYESISSGQFIINPNTAGEAVTSVVFKSVTSKYPGVKE